MSAATIVAAAVTLTLFIVVGYVIIGSTLTANEAVLFAQRDISHIQEKIARSKVDITNFEYHTDGKINLTIQNTGAETIEDLKHLDIYYYNKSGTFFTYTYGGSTGSDGKWTIYPSKEQLNPGDSVTLQFLSSPPTSVEESLKIKVATANGVSDYYTLSYPALPVLSSMNPQFKCNASESDPPFDLTISGTNFTTNSQVAWDGVPRSTNYSSSTLLVTSIDNLNYTEIRPFNVSVIDSETGLTSNNLTFTILNSSFCQ
jgi:archaellum component FlaF (FlaF/FlaG flagellin family)